MMMKSSRNENPDAYLTILEDTVSVFEGLDRSHDEEALNRHKGEGSYSAKENLAPLISCQQVWSYSVYAILISHEPELEHIHPRDWAKLMRYEDLPFQSGLGIFLLDRRQLFRTLEFASDETWVRSANIDGRRHTVLSQIRRMAKHERDHWPQLQV